MPTGTPVTLVGFLVAHVFKRHQDQRDALLFRQAGEGGFAFADLQGSDLIGAGEEAAHAFKTEEGEEGQPQDIATARVTKRAECARPSLALCCSQAKRRSSGRSSRFGRMMRRAARQPCSRRSRSPKRLSFPPAANA